MSLNGTPNDAHWARTADRRAGAIVRRLARLMLMLVDGGRERTAAQHAALFEQAGLRFEREISTPGPITLFEGVRA